MKGRATQLAEAPPGRDRMPAQFVWWAGASSLSVLGTAVLGFGIAWFATGINAHLAGLVVTLEVAPRTLLLLLGGVVADRVGARRVMILGDAAMCVATALFAVAAHTSGLEVWLLLAMPVIGGIVDAFYLPSSGAMPRLFLEPASVPRGMALAGGLREIALLGGPPAGALVVMGVGLAGGATVDAVTFALVLVVLMAVRPAGEEAGDGDAVPLLTGILASLREIRRDPLTRGLLGPIGLLACAVLPLIGLGTSMLARSRGWSAGAAGVIESAWFAGTLTVTLIVARTGMYRRPGIFAGVAPVVGGAAIVLMAVAGGPPLAAVGAVLLGVGVAGCTSHAAPMLLLATPRDQMSRYQAVFVLVQSIPLLVTNNLFASVASAWGMSVALLLAAALTAGSGVWLLAVPSVRTSTRPES